MVLVGAAAYGGRSRSRSSLRPSIFQILLVHLAGNTRLFVRTTTGLLGKLSHVASRTDGRKLKTAFELEM